MPDAFKSDKIFRILFLIIAGLFSYNQTVAQTNPVAQPIPYAQDFGTGLFSSPPAGFAAWNASGSPCISNAVAALSTGTADQSIDSASVCKINGDVYGYSGFSEGVPNTNGQVYIQTSAHLSMGSCQLVLAVNTTGYNSISVGYDVEMISPQPRLTGVVMQFRVGNAGAWTTVNSTYWHNNADRLQYQVDNFFTSLNATSDNQPVVQIRWATSHASTPAGNSCGIAIDNIVVNGNPISAIPKYYRSIGSGNWSNPATWETSLNNFSWTAATGSPTSTDYSIIIQSPHTVSTAGISSLVIDETTINSGATLWNAIGTTLSINNGAGSVDLDINGTFEDSSSSAVVFNNNSTWRLGPSGTLIKATNSNSRNWQMKYYNGISTIPSTSNWVFRKPLGFGYEPLFASTTYNPPCIKDYYGNVFFENNAVSWNSYNLCRFSGTQNSPVIKGNLYIGGNGNGSVAFLNTNSYVSPVLILGDMTIKAGSSFLNQGTGVEVQGNVINNGTISYLPYNPTFIFSGGNNQLLSGTGTFSTFNFQLNKSANSVTSNQTLCIDGSLILSNGRLVTTALSPVVLNDNTTVVNASNSSFVAGPVVKLGDDAFTFPVGKNADYQPIAISAGPAKTPFWTENFNNGCVAGCQAISYSGPNGSWTQTLTGTNGTAANVWYVSGKECGNSNGNCQSICTGDASLHIGSGVITTLDSGATYNHGVAGPLVIAETSKRMQSPVINCSGKYNIIVDFVYIEGGNSYLDNAIFEYFNGSTWITCADLAKTSTGSCPGGTNVWTNFRMALPGGASNNANVRIGIKWVNDADGIGVDPSFAIDDISLTDQGETFTAEYFHTDPQSVYGNAVSPLLNHISHCEYWNLTHNIGVASKNVTLSFDANSCGVTNLSSLHVARFNSPTWTDEGQTGISGTTVSGTVTSNLISGFGPFTLSSLTNDNPLPVTLLNFEAFLKDYYVTIKWRTASEFNSDYFTVQRSKDGVSFENLIRLDGAGTSTKPITYSAVDPTPFQGFSYYRLRSTDFNGSISYSKTVSVNFVQNIFDIASVGHFAGQAGIESTLVLPDDGNAALILTDILGRKILSKIIPVTRGQNKIVFPGTLFNSGIYFMQVIYKDQKITRRFVY